MLQLIKLRFEYLLGIQLSQFPKEGRGVDGCLDKRRLGVRPVVSTTGMRIGGVTVTVGMRVSVDFDLCHSCLLA